MERFKLKQKIERETAKAENIRLMREQVRQDAVGQTWLRRSGIASRRKRLGRAAPQLRR